MKPRSYVSSPAALPYRGGPHPPSAPRRRPAAGTVANRGTTARRRLVRAAAVLAGLLAVLLGSAVPASAHAALIRTDPAQGSVVPTAPQRIVLTFSEGVLLSSDSLRVLDPRGTDVAVGTPGHAGGPDSGSTATVGIKPGIGNGTYTVAWRAISQDSHPVSGAFTFSIGAASQTAVDLSGVAHAGGGTATMLYGIARWFAYAGFALLVGASVFLAVCWPRGALHRTLQRLASGGWATIVAATIALIMLRGPYVDGKGLGEAFDLSVMRASLETRPGAALLSRLLLLAAAAVFLAVLFGSYARREDPEERADLAWGLGIGGTVVAVGIAATWAMAEHASVGIQRRLAMPVDVLHLLSMATWLGGLITLLTALWAPSLARTRIPAFAVRRFSAIALASITLLVATGIYQAWRQVGTWRAFTDTSYGRLLLIKIGLVATLVAIAWFSRRWTAALGRPAAVAGTASAAGGARSAGAASSAGAPAAAKGGAAVASKGGRNRRPKRTRADEGAATASRTAVSAAATAGAKAAPVTARIEPAAESATGAGAAAAGPAEPAGNASTPAATTDAGAGNGTRNGASAIPRPGETAGGDSHTGDRPATAPGASGSPSGSATTGRRAAELRRQEAARAAATARRTLAGDPARAALRRSVLAEAGVAVVLLAVTTILSGSQPGRAAEEQKALGTTPPATAATPAVPAALTVPYDTGGPKGKGTATVSLSPGRAGTPNELHLELAGPDHLPVAVPEVRVAFTLPAQHLGPIPVRLVKLGTGHYVATGVALPLPGTWQLAVTVRTSDIDEVTVTRSLQIAS